MGRDPAEKIFVKKEISLMEFEPDFDEILEMTMLKNSGLLISEQNKIIADQNVKIARSVYYLRLFLNANYGYSDRLISSDSPRFTSDIETKSRDGV